MRQRLKLPGPDGGPIAKDPLPFRRPGLADDARQEHFLRNQRVGLQTGLLAGSADSGKIDVRGQVLLPGISQQVWGDLVTAIAAQGALGALRPEGLSVPIAIINGKEFALRQGHSLLATTRRWPRARPRW